MAKEIKENNVLYAGSDEWINTRTGETIKANQIIKKTDRNGFMITYLSAIINLIETLGNRKMQVVKYILENMDKSTNTLILTNRELAKKANVSLDTVSKTLTILKKAKIVTSRTGAIMINPELVHRGNVSKEQYLLTRFQEFDEDKGVRSNEI
ncbi:replication/maintenance protein RepL [Clostridium sp. ZS1]|uniref:replication/maintenance protein RepL n=1 Tax=Clostridium sp. ZS1 TaxID=2949989 RepID=UPI0020795C76|nr:replication/maintenance protein RepL [Clostridium sp. ZS1]